jgi:hypothetical protein
VARQPRLIRDPHCRLHGGKRAMQVAEVVHRQPKRPVRH